MKAAHHLKRILVAALLSGTIAVAGFGLAAGTAQANTRGPYHWYWVDYGFQANRGHFVYEGDNPPPNLGCIPGLCLPGL
jgi:hypothetical protein